MKFIAQVFALLVFYALCFLVPLFIIKQIENYVLKRRERSMRTTVWRDKRRYKLDSVNNVITPFPVQ